MNNGMEEQEQKGGDRSEQSCQDVGAQTVESANDFFGALRREKALDVGDAENQHRQQNQDFDRII